MLGYSTGAQDGGTGAQYWGTGQGGVGTCTPRRRSCLVWLLIDAAKLVASMLSSWWISAQRPASSSGSPGPTYAAHVYRHV